MPRGPQYCMEPRTFVVACETYRSPVAVLSTFIHWSRVNPTPRELHRTGKAANPRCSSIRSTQRPRELPSAYSVIMEKAMYFFISDTVHARSCTIPVAGDTIQECRSTRSWSLKFTSFPFRTRSRPRQSLLPAFIKKEIQVGSVRKGHVLVWSPRYLIRRVLVLLGRLLPWL